MLARWRVGVEDPRQTPTRPVVSRNVRLIAAAANAAAQPEAVEWVRSCAASHRISETTLLDAIFDTFATSASGECPLPAWDEPGWRSVETVNSLLKGFDLAAYRKRVPEEEDAGKRRDGEAEAYTSLRFVCYLDLDSFDPRVADWYLDFFKYKPREFFDAFPPPGAEQHGASTKAKAREWAVLRGMR